MNPQTSERSSASWLRGSGRSRDSTSASWRTVIAGLDQREGLAFPHCAAQLRENVEELDDDVEHRGKRSRSEQGHDPAAAVDVVDRPSLLPLAQDLLERWRQWRSWMTNSRWC
jgi:hypothetical protein